MEHPRTIRVLALNVDTLQMTLYLSSGEELIIKQGDPRLKIILEQAKEKIEFYGYADIEIPTPDNPYASYEKETNGVIKFYRIAKSFIKNLFTSDEPEEVKPQSVNSDFIKKKYKSEKALSDVMSNAIPTDHPNFDLSKDNEEYTTIAVSNGEVIDGVEKLERQIDYAVKTKNSVGITNLIKRLLKIIHLRKHSVEDLLKFIEFNDLPVTDAGDVIVYKFLHPLDNGTFVDWYSKKIVQGVGTMVEMDEKLVDPNRSQPCSYGLHVARRNYLSGWGKNNGFIALVRPEDFIAVPYNDANKTRVCRYHLLHQMTHEEYQKLCTSKSLTEYDLSMGVISRIIKGDHIGVLEQVILHDKSASKITRKSNKPTEIDTPENEKFEVEVMPRGGIKPIDIDSKETNQILDTPVDPKQLRKSSEPKKEVVREKVTTNVKPPKTKKVTKPKTKSRNELIAEKLQKLDAKSAQEIIDLKRVAKKGWAKLGVTPEQAKQIESLVKK